MTEEIEGAMSTGDRLVYMANQIARNLAAQGQAEAETMVADHIRAFWDPGMRARIVEIARECPSALSPIAAAAIGRITVG